MFNYIPKKTKKGRFGMQTGRQIRAANGAVSWVVGSLGKGQDGVGELTLKHRAGNRMHAQNQPEGTTREMECG